MVPLPIQLTTSTLRKVIKRLHYPLKVMLVCVRWYAAYPLSLRNFEEMMAESGVGRRPCHGASLGDEDAASSGGAVSRPQAIGRFHLEGG